VNLELELKNYRCFPDDLPARVTVREGFTSFVGTNNSGKSSLLRMPYELRDLFSRFSRTNSSDLANAFRAPSGFNPQGLQDYAELFSDANDRSLTISLAITDAPETQGIPVADELEITVQRTGQAATARPRRAGRYLDTSRDTGWTGENIAYDHVGQLADLTPYIAAFDVLARTIYVGPFRNAINIGSNEQYYDLQVGQAFITQWNTLKTGGERRTAAAALAITDDIRRLFGFRSLEINASADGRSLAVVVDGRPYRLHELGAGIAHFIVVLVNVAVRRPALVLIDEPEMGLHPSLQLDFLTTLASYATHGVIYATHSLGLARAGSNSIYSFRRIEQGRGEVRPYEATPRLAEFLGELNFAGYQELGFDAVLLVEGATDVTAFQRLLRLYGIEHRLVLLPLGGSSLINADADQQLVELTRITSNIACIIDSERSESDEPLGAPRQAFVDACARLGIDCRVLERRALENYFSERAVRDVKGSKYRALGEFEPREDVDPHWSKSENWKIAGAMTKHELAETDLGQALEQLVVRLAPS
jgi:ABC-type cobalamin/Fe3+-siderophores transport system ATPase subunit